MEPFLVGSSILLWIVVLFILFLTMALVRQVNRLVKAEDIGNRVHIETLKPGVPAPPYWISSETFLLGYFMFYKRLYQASYLMYVTSYPY